MFKKVPFFLCLFLFLPLSSFSKVSFDGLSYHFSMEFPSAKDIILLFSFDHYTTQYHMERDVLNPTVFNLNLDTPKVGKIIKPGRYYYRVVVDGVMTYDETNPQSEIIPLIGTLSYFDISNIYLDNYSGPIAIGPHEYRFFYHQDSKSKTPNQVLLTSNYDAWNLYAHILKPSKEDPSVWYVDIKFDYPTKVNYAFIVDGTWVSDWNNTNTVTNEVGQELSVLNVE